jgi:hypothetical protein
LRQIASNFKAKGRGVQTDLAEMQRSVAAIPTELQGAARQDLEM